MVVSSTCEEYKGSDNTVYCVGKSVLETAMDMVGTDGLISIDNSDELESFVDISAMKVMGQTGTLNAETLNGLKYFTSFMTKDYVKEEIKNNLRTKISWVQTTCVCKDGECSKSYAVDPVGVFDVTKGIVRGRSMLVFLGEDGNPMPCLTHVELPPIENLEISGSCESTVESRGNCSDSEGEFQKLIPGLHSWRCVKCKGDKLDGIDGIKILNKDGTEVARTLDPKETTGLENPFRTVEDELNGQTIPDIPPLKCFNISMGLTEVPFKNNLGGDTLRNLFKGFLDALGENHTEIKTSGETIVKSGFGDYTTPDIDINDSAQNFVRSGMKGIANFILGNMIGNEYDVSNIASEATLVEIIRSADIVSYTSLANFANLDPKSVRNSTDAEKKKIERDISIVKKITSLPVYKTMETEHPDEVPPQEIVSGITLLLIASCAFGTVIGNFFRKKKESKNHRSTWKSKLNSLLPLLASLVIVVLECIAYALRWEEENELLSFKKSIVYTEVKGADRRQLTSRSLLLDDLTGTGFVTTTFVSEISDVSADRRWIFIAGAIVSVVGLLLSFLYGYSLDDEDEGMKSEGNEMNSNEQYDEEKGSTTVENPNAIKNRKKTT